MKAFQAWEPGNGSKGSLTGTAGSPDLREERGRLSHDSMDRNQWCNFYCSPGSDSAMM